MDYFLLALALVMLWIFNARVQLRRIVLLGSFLSRFQIEKLMETLVDGYLRAAGEAEPQRASTIWGMLQDSEVALVRQLHTLAQDFAQVPESAARFSTLPLALPLAARWWPAATADMRSLLRLHAQGIAAVVADAAERAPKERAFMLTAELMLFQHSCHWFCRSKAVAHARVLARHQTAYPQVLAAVSAETRAAYLQCLHQRSTA